MIKETLGIANLDNALDIKNLLDKAYRGESSLKGWTSEANLISGTQRATLAQIQDILQDSKSIFITYSIEQQLVGCAHVQQKNNNSFYFGMFAVLPTLQGKGIGKKILAAAEQHVLKQQGNTLEMTVISERHDLIQWYCQLGFKNTHTYLPFKEDGFSGKHLKPLQFLILTKNLLGH